MFFTIKAKLFKVLRTIPNIWICGNSGVTHCWLPKVGYSHKMKNRAQPPNETDVEARNEWHFIECEILFNGKVFVSFMDGEFALSKLNYSPEWYFNPEEVNRLQPVNEIHLSVDTHPKPNTTLPVTQLVQNDDVHVSRIDNVEAIVTPIESTTLTDTTSAVECYSVDNSHIVSHPMTDLEKYEENKRLCQLHNFRQPMNYQKFNKLQWNYVKTFDINNLRPGCSFQSIEELASKKRRYAEIPFCRPGPLKRDKLYDWYLVDSIVQEVFLKSHTYPFYVIRWLGYEDEYNTVEPLAYVEDTSVYELFVNPSLSTACRAKNGCILRRSSGKVLAAETDELQMDVGRVIYELTISRIVHELQIEKEAGRYSPLIGFCSFQGTLRAWKAQHEFLQDKFLPMVNQLDSTLYLDEHYAGQIFGNLSNVTDFKAFTSMGVRSPATLKCYIDRGLSINSATSEPRYVSFLVPRKFKTNENKKTIQMDLHMCVFIVRSYGDQKDAIYYDPSPKCFSHGLPDVLDELRKPVLKSFTKAYGVASEKDDCVFQCMRYIIGIATNEIPFEPDLSEPCRTIDKFVAERARKKMKMNT